MRKAPSVRPSCRALGGWPSPSQPETLMQSRPPSSSRWQVRRAVLRRPGPRGPRHSRISEAIRSVQIWALPSLGGLQVTRDLCTPVLPCSRLSTSSHSLCLSQSVRGHVTRATAASRRQPSGRVRADDPRVSPGRLLCSWACQVMCVQLLTIQIRLRSHARLPPTPLQRKGYAMPTDDPETLVSRLPAALAAVQATQPVPLAAA